MNNTRLGVRAAALRKIKNGGGGQKKATTRSVQQTTQPKTRSLSGVKRGCGCGRK